MVIHLMSIKIIFTAPPFFVVWARPDLNRRPAEWITPFSATVSGSFVSIALPLSYCPMLPGCSAGRGFVPPGAVLFRLIEFCSESQLAVDFS